MISKKELLQERDNLQATSMSPEKKWIFLFDWIQSLPDDQPDLLPFQWPIPDGMEVCYYNEGKFYYVLTDVVYHPNASKEYCDVSGIDDIGHLHLYRMADLFLRRKEKKVWVVDYNGVLDFYEEKKEATDHNENVYDGEAKVYQILVKPVK